MRHSRQIAVGPAKFRIGSDWRAPLEALDGLYRDYPARDGPADFTVRLEAPRPWRRVLRPQVHVGGDYRLPDAVPVSLAHGLLAAEMGMNLQMALGWRRHLLLHASGVERDGRALVMTGASGSGKSTLAAMLGEAGWRFCGDEFALIGLEDGALAPFPRAISLKNRAIAAMQAVVSDAVRFGPLLTETPKGDIRHLRPRAEAVMRMGEAAMPALLLFPRYGHERAVRELTAPEVFVRLTQASTNYVALGEAGFRALTRLIDTVPARAIDYRSGEEARELIETLWEELA